MIAHSLLVPVAAVLIAVPFFAQQPEVPLVSTRRAALQAKFEELHRAGSFPGGTAGFALADGSSFGIAAGVSDRTAKAPMKPTDRLLLGSVGKTYVSAVALQLVHEGRIGLDDPIAQVSRRRAVVRARCRTRAAITVRQLMNHTSGLVRYELNPKFTADLSANPDKVWTPAERLAYLLDAKPPFAAGQGWEYSDTNYIVLGMIIEQTGSAPYYEQLRAADPRPLRLDDTVPADSRRVPGLVRATPARTTRSAAPTR